jgi:hypothetical protein
MYSRLLHYQGKYWVPKKLRISLNVDKKNLGATTCKSVLRRYEMCTECGEQQVSVPVCRRLVIK